MHDVGFDLQIHVDCEQSEHCDRDSALKALNPVLCVTGRAPGPQGTSERSYSAGGFTQRECNETLPIEYFHNSLRLSN